ncbi:host cell division inhibitor Icd-like protein [Klebsiella variicola]|uniref:host cell division inhibitor Icd-like protein n=1 Tax=Klebsiella variicola TaxID=244366 RepID=UPI00209A88FD|nr:host cell division inhibitor Icd-like protein [Klebsiella variicola]
MNAKANALLVVCHHGNLSKPVTFRANDSGSIEVYFGTSTRAGKRSETDYLENSVSGASGGCGVHHTASYKLPHRNKKGLRPDGIPVYGYRVPAKSGARIGVLTTLKATHDAPSVFFCAVSLTHPFFERWYIIQRLSRAMVAQAGASSEAPVSFRAGYANPVWATTSEIGVSGGGVTRYLKEAATMATTPTQIPQFIWIIAAVRRDMTTIKAQIHHIAAPSERDARRSLVRDHVCFFAGRIRLEVAHA